MVANNIPSHLPNINPANNASGQPNPAAKTHIDANRIKDILNKNKFDSLNS